MSKRTKDVILPWMQNLADKHGIDAETVFEFYKSITYDTRRRQRKRERTEEFFDLYFEGRNNE